MTRRYKPKGWRGEPHRHYLAAKGIKTKYTKHKYFRKKEDFQEDFQVQDNIKNIPIKGGVDVIGDTPPFRMRLIANRDKVVSIGPFSSLKEAKDAYRDVVKTAQDAEYDMTELYSVQILDAENSDRWSDDPPTVPFDAARGKNLDELFGTQDLMEELAYDMATEFGVSPDTDMGGKEPIWVTHAPDSRMEITDIRDPSRKKVVVKTGKKWMGTVPDTDDFGNEIEDEFVDGLLRSDQGMRWAIMSPESFRIHGSGLGKGLGQRYKKIDGKWEQIEGGMRLSEGRGT